MQTRSQKSALNQNAVAPTDEQAPELLRPSEEVSDGEEEFFDALDPLEELLVTATQTATENPPTNIFSNSASPMDLGHTDPSLPDRVRAPQPGPSLPNAGSLATAGVNVHVPKNIVPIPFIPPRSLCASLLLKHREPFSENQFQNATSTDFKVKLPTEPKGWSKLNKKMSETLELAREDLERANNDLDTSSTTISSVLSDLIQSVLKENLPKIAEKGKSPAPPAPQPPKLSKPIKDLKSEIAQTKEELKLLDVKINRAGKVVKDARKAKARKGNRKRRSSKKKLLEEKKQALKVLKKLSSEFVERTTSEKSGVFEFLKNP